jgi:intracellular sulfur oxidation DsrE/DsrF family protein
MNPFGPTPRRGFLTRLAGTAAAVGLGGTLPRSLAAQPLQASGQDAWLDKQTGAHRCLFDFPANGGGTPLIHMLNYLNTYASAYGTKPGEVNAIGTLYFVGPTSSIPLAFNDAMWEKYKLGAYLNLEDPKTKAPSTRNMFNLPQSGDPVLFGGAFAAAGIANLQKMGSTFLLCNNALGLLVGQLAQQSGATPAAVSADLKANLLPGVVLVPAMVIAIEKAQSKGIAYNKQG